MLVTRLHCAYGLLVADKMTIFTEDGPYDIEPGTGVPPIPSHIQSDEDRQEYVGGVLAQRALMEAEDS